MDRNYFMWIYFICIFYLIESSQCLRLRRQTTIAPDSSSTFRTKKRLSPELCILSVDVNPKWLNYASQAGLKDSFII